MDSAENRGCRNRRSKTVAWLLTPRRFRATVEPGAGAVLVASARPEPGVWCDCLGGGRFSLAPPEWLRSPGRLPPR